MWGIRIKESRRTKWIHQVAYLILSVRQVSRENLWTLFSSLTTLPLWREALFHLFFTSARARNSFTRLVKMNTLKLTLLTRVRSSPHPSFERNMNGSLNLRFSTLSISTTNLAFFSGFPPFFKFFVWNAFLLIQGIDIHTSGSKIRRVSYISFRSLSVQLLANYFNAKHLQIV